MWQRPTGQKLPKQKLKTYAQQKKGSKPLTHIADHQKLTQKLPNLLP